MIDRGIPEEWPDGLRTASGRFKQGHLVPTPPFFYAASAAYGVWDLTRDFGDPDIAEEVLQLDDDLVPPFGLITTQTCDIFEEGDPIRPWIQVAPVYDAAEIIDQDSVGNLKADKFIYLMHLDAPHLGEGLWVVDLRIEVPIEKSWLVAREPLEAFASEARYLILADKLAARVGRPALSDGLIAVWRFVREWWRNADSDARTEVASIRLAVVDGDRLNPASAYLVIVTEAAPMSGAGQDAWTECWRQASEIADSVGINLAANLHGTLDSLTARQFRDSAPLLP